MPSLPHFPVGQSSGRWHQQRSFGGRRDRSSEHGGDRSGTARTISQPSLLKSLKTVSVAVERNLSPGLLLLRDAEYLSPLCFLSFSLTHVNTFAGTTNYVNQREVISGREMFAGCYQGGVTPCCVWDVGKRMVRKGCSENQEFSSRLQQQPAGLGKEGLQCCFRKKKEKKQKMKENETFQ